MAQDWADGLAGMTPEQMRAAIDHCRNTMKWAPTIAEFRAASLGDMTAEQRVMARALEAADADRLALPSKTWAERRESGRAQAAAILASLRGEGEAA